LIRSGENDPLLLLPGSEAPVALYDEGDEADSEFCSDCRNCCRMSSGELVPEELPRVLLVEDEPSAGGAPPWPP
jgi:hypothetical protein